jgi:hypothetical protein
MDFDLVGYLSSMLSTCVLALEGTHGEMPDVLGSLDSGATRTLLSALVVLNHGTDNAVGGNDPLANLAPVAAAATLRVCRALGWTPTQVMETPAVDVQRLLALLEITEHEVFPTTPEQHGAHRTFASRQRPLIADHPDAVVLLFDEEANQ